MNKQEQHVDSNNLDDFVPDDVLDKSFLDDTSHGDIVIKGNKETELDSDRYYLFIINFRLILWQKYLLTPYALKLIATIYYLICYVHY